MGTNINQPAAAGISKNKDIKRDTTGNVVFTQKSSGSYTVTTHGGVTTSTCSTTKTRETTVNANNVAQLTVILKGGIHWQSVGDPSNITSEYTGTILFNGNTLTSTASTITTPSLNASGSGTFFPPTKTFTTSVTEPGTFTIKQRAHGNWSNNTGIVSAIISTSLSVNQVTTVV